jgi:hypothetical protein
VCGFIEPLDEDSAARYVFSNEMVGTVIPPEYYPACEKGFREAANAGALIGAPVEVSRKCAQGVLHGEGVRCRGRTPEPAGIVRSPRGGGALRGGGGSGTYACACRDCAKCSRGVVHGGWVGVGDIRMSLLILCRVLEGQEYREDGTRLRGEPAQAEQTRPVCRADWSASLSCTRVQSASIGQLLTTTFLLLLCPLSVSCMCPAGHSRRAERWCSPRSRL